MANLYTPESLSIRAPSGGFQQGGWYQGRQYWDGLLSDPGVINPRSNQQGAGQLVSAEVNAQSAAQQGVTPQQFEGYLQQQRQLNPSPTAAPSPAQPTGIPTNSPGGMSGGMVASPTPSPINLPELYSSMYNESGVKELESQLADLERQKTEVVGKVNDNPYLSEGTRVGRVNKIEALHAERTKNLRDEIAMKKADIETRLNLQMKQFDLDSQATRDAWDRFNTLLTSGALNTASGDTIAEMTRMTGIPSDAIMSAVNAQKDKNRQTQIIKSEDNEGNVTVNVLDTQTGQIISTSNLGRIGTASSSGSGSGGSSRTNDNQFMSDASSLQPIDTDQGHVGIFPQLVAKYAPFYSLQQIYSLYLKSDIGKKYGTPVESAQEIKEVYDYYRGK